jgi:DNA-binding transcriptional LysR family regulator
MFLICRACDDIAWTYLDLRFARALRPTKTGSHDQRLTAWVHMPCRARAGFERDKRPTELTRSGRLEQTYGGLYAWEFEKNGRPLNVRVNGQVVCNSPGAILAAALQGLGIAYLPEDMVRMQIAQKSLMRVLGDWCPSFPGYHLYYPSKRQPSPAFALLVEALRFRS